MKTLYGLTEDQMNEVYWAVNNDKGAQIIREYISDYCEGLEMPDEETLLKMGEDLREIVEIAFFSDDTYKDAARSCIENYIDLKEE